MKFGLQLPNIGAFVDVKLLVEVAQEAEEAGWDGFFLWDHAAIPDAMIDPMTIFGAIAVTTTRIRFGPMITAPSRRRPWKLAREATTLDHLSDGRFVLGVGLGASDWDFAKVGEESRNKIKARRTDEALDIINRLWQGEIVNFEGEHFQVADLNFRPRPIQQPRIPIWCAGLYPNRAPLRRAAQWDGIFPISPDDRPLTPDEWRNILHYIMQHRQDQTPFEAIHTGITQDASDTLTVEPYADVGVTWWLEDISPVRVGWKLSQSSHWGDEWDTKLILSRISLGIPQIEES